MEKRETIALSAVMALGVLGLVWEHFSVGANIALFRAMSENSTSIVALPIGSYPKAGSEAEIRKAFSVALQKRIPQITVSDVEVSEKPLFYDYSTYPPSPSAPFDLEYEILSGTGAVSQRTIRSIDIRGASISTAFLNRILNGGCKRMLLISPCYSSYELIDGTIYMIFPRPG